MFYQFKRLQNILSHMILLKITNLKLLRIIQMLWCNFRAWQEVTVYLERMENL